MTFSGHTWFLFIISVPLGKHRAEHCVLECLFTTTISRPKNVLFWRHLHPCLNRTPGFSASPHFLVFYKYHSLLFSVSFLYIHVLKVTAHFKWLAVLLWKVTILTSYYTIHIPTFFLHISESSLLFFVTALREFFTTQFKTSSQVIKNNPLWLHELQLWSGFEYRPLSDVS